jgi:hypothetical protein
MGQKDLVFLELHALYQHNVFLFFPIVSLYAAVTLCSFYFHKCSILGNLPMFFLLSYIANPAFGLLKYHIFYVPLFLSTTMVASYYM